MQFKKAGLQEGRLPGHETGSTANDARILDKQDADNAATPVVESEDFHVKVDKVLDAARNKGFVSVVVISLDDKGEVIVAGSDGTPQVLNLIAQAQLQITRSDYA